MDIESLGGGAGAGFLTAILTAFGINKRVGNLEDYKQDKTVCEVIKHGMETRLERIEEKLDDLNTYLRNHKGGS